MLHDVLFQKSLLHNHNNISAPFSILKKSFHLLLTIVVFVSCISKNDQAQANSITGKTYYVSISGDDNNPGTTSSPFKTLQKVNTLIIQPGDAIYLRGGETFNGKLSITLNGTKTNPVLLTSYSEGRAVIDGGKDQAISLGGQY